LGAATIEHSSTFVSRKHDNQQRSRAAGDTRTALPLPTQARVPAHPLVYILAPSHSGSTLLAMLLGSHPEICSAGELKATSLGPVLSYRCSCGQLIGECPFWQAVKAAMARRGVTFDVTASMADLRSGASPAMRRLLRPLHRGRVLEALRDLALRSVPGWRAHLAHIQDVNTALVQSLAECSGARVVVDSSKIGIRLKYLLTNAALSVKVIRLVRDGRATALTYMDPERYADAQQAQLRGGGSGRSRDDERLSVEAAAHEWRRSTEEGGAIVARLPRQQWVQIRYEDLCADPGAVINALCAFIGVSGVANMASFKTREHHVIGNGMRFDRSNEIALDERWRTALDADHLRAFDRTAGELNRRLGYA
jgi:hypothetical protein